MQRAQSAGAATGGHTEFAAMSAPDSRHSSAAAAAAVAVLVERQQWRGFSILALSVSSSRTTLTVERRAAAAKRRRDSPRRALFFCAQIFAHKHKQLFAQFAHRRCEQLGPGSRPKFLIASLMPPTLPAAVASDDADHDEVSQQNRQLPYKSWSLVSRRLVAAAVRERELRKFIRLERAQHQFAAKLNFRPKTQPTPRIPHLCARN